MFRSGSEISENDGAAPNQCINKVSHAAEMLRGIQEVSDLSNLFFGQQNIDRLQWLLQRNIYVNSLGKYTIDRQDDSELLIIMRSVYLEYSLNNKFDYQKQIDALNEKVLEYAVPQVLSAVNLYAQYRNDSSKPLRTLDRPQYESMSGTKSYDLSRFL